MNIYIHENMKQVTRIRYKTEDNPPMANVPLIGYSKKYDCWVALVYRKGGVTITPIWSAMLNTRHPLQMSTNTYIREN